jgi:hypothetical protein
MVKVEDYIKSSGVALFATLSSPPYQRGAGGLLLRKPLSPVVPLTKGGQGGCPLRDDSTRLSPYVRNMLLPNTFQRFLLYPSFLPLRAG